MTASAARVSRTAVSSIEIVRAAYSAMAERSDKVVAPSSASIDPPGPNWYAARTR
jgi:hypothetical protein